MSKSRYKLTFTKVAVLTFIILLLAAANSAFAAEARIGLGHTLFNSHSTTGEVGIEARGWEANIGLIGSGETKNGQQNLVKTYSISKLVRPDWSFLGGKNYYRIGLGYIDDSPLVGGTNFRLGVGLEYKVFQIEYLHYSSAGIHKTNTGIDALMLRLKLPF